MDNIMLDIETFGTKPGSVIVSIGAVRFDTTHTGEQFYKICYKRQSHRKLDMDTLIWWMKQGHDARQVFRDKPVVGLEYALNHLREFIGRDDKVWANGVTFDISILEEAFRSYNINPPWRYGNIRCLRSIRHIYPEWKDYLGQNNHNALDDCKGQIIALQKVAQERGFKL